MGITYAINEKFFDEWDYVMAYVLGYWYADGAVYISARGHYLAVLSIDRDTMVKIKRWMKSEHPIVMSSAFGNRKATYRLRIGNKKLYQALLRRGIFPSKSLTITFPEVPINFLSSFVLGYLDGDGCITLERVVGKKGKLIVKKFSIIFSSGSKEFLEGLLRALKQELDLRQTRVYNGRRCYQLRFGTTDSVLLSQFLYQGDGRKICLPRKLKILDNYMRLRPERFLGECFINGRLKNTIGGVAKQ